MFADKRVLLSGALTALLFAGQTVDASEIAPAHETLLITSRTLQQTRRVNVYLPPGYDRCEQERYPVLYMPDGGLHEDFPHVARTADDLIRSSRTRPFIVVGLENVDRRYDMTSSTDESIAADQPDVRTGGADALRAFLRTELKPVMSRRYRANGTTAILGESLAGLFIVETLFEMPDLFDRYVALDPSLWWGNEKITAKSAAHLQAWGDKPKVSLHLASAGEESNAEYVARLVEVLRTHPTDSVEWTYESRPDLTHATIYRAMKVAVLERLFPPASPREPPGCT